MLDEADIGGGVWLRGVGVGCLFAERTITLVSILKKMFASCLGVFRGSLIGPFEGGSVKLRIYFPRTGRGDLKI